MSIIVGLTKITYFAKPTNLARIEIMTQQNRHIFSWRFSQKWEIWEKGELSKNPSMIWQNLKWGGKKAILTKGRFPQNIASVPKIHQGFGQILKWDDKKVHVDSWRFLGQWQILRRWQIWQTVIKGLTKRWHKGASWQMAIITNMANWATVHLRFVKIQTRHVDNCEFYENAKFGKNTWKAWSKFKWDAKKGYLDNDWFFEEGKFLPKMVNSTKANQMLGKNS